MPVTILPESYEACSQAAYEAFALAFQSLLAERLRMAGYTGGTDGESIEALVNETFGMSPVAYLTPLHVGFPLLQRDGDALYVLQPVEGHDSGPAAHVQLGIPLPGKVPLPGLEEIQIGKKRGGST